MSNALRVGADDGQRISGKRKERAMRLIDGDALIAWIKESQHQTSKMRNVICKIESMPSADRQQGEWIEVTNGRGGHECSNCHAYAPSYMSGDEHLSDFCPNCGARMKGADDETD